MSINDWTTTIAAYQRSLSTAKFEIERMQAVYMLGSCLTVMSNELSASDTASVLTFCAMNKSEADVYKARFAGHAQARVEA